jgi:vacuolar-type H+-ATPase subunit H
MEKVWEELKKIENQAEQIRKEAQKKTKEINQLAQQESEKLLANAKTYVEEEVRQLLQSTIEEANKKRQEQLSENQLAADQLKHLALKRMDKAEAALLKAIVGETSS